MLRELKVFLDQLERDVLRAQGTEGSLADKYQVSEVWQMDCSILLWKTHLAMCDSFFFRHLRTSVSSMK